MSAKEQHLIAELQGKWVGTFQQDSHDSQESAQMILTVDHIDGQEFSGTMDWPDNNSCKTKIQGSFDGIIVKWTETQYIQGDDVVLYGLYVARFTGKDKISGSWMDPKHTIDPKGPVYGVPGGSFLLQKH